jgi:hypothetical protein
MTFEIHPLMEDAHYFDPVGHGANEQHVRARGIFPVSGAKTIARPSLHRVLSHRFDGAMKSQNVAIRLV